MKKENNIHASLDDEQKALLSKTLGIAVDSDLFDPRYDYVFKRIFTADNKKSKLALIDFLNSVLGFSGKDEIVDLTVINTEIPVDEIAQKKSVFDIRVVFKDGEQAIVEMELRAKDDFKKRSQFLISKAYSNQRIAGMQYEDLKKCYLICITNFTLFGNDTEYGRDFMYRDIKAQPLTDDLTIVFLELSKLGALLNKPVEALSGMEMWAIFLRYASDKEKRNLLNEILNRKEGIKMGAQILEMISKDEKERMLYESQLLYEADMEAAWRYRERKAIEKGREEGIEEGMEKGIEKGRLIVAKSLIQKNFPLDTIADSTGISIETLKTL